MLTLEPCAYAETVSVTPNIVTHVSCRQLEEITSCNNDRQWLAIDLLLATRYRDTTVDDDGAG